MTGLWISGPLPLNSTASLHRSLWSPEPTQTPFRADPRYRFTLMCSSTPHHTTPHHTTPHHTTPHHTTQERTCQGRCPQGSLTQIRRSVILVKRYYLLVNQGHGFVLRVVPSVLLQISFWVKYTISSIELLNRLGASEGKLVHFHRSMCPSSLCMAPSCGKKLARIFVSGVVLSCVWYIDLLRAFRALGGFCCRDGHPRDLPCPCGEHSSPNCCVYFVRYWDVIQKTPDSIRVRNVNFGV